MKKLTKSQFCELLFNAGIKFGQRQPDYRRGQALYNSLHDIDFELAESICGGDCDPFYNNDKIPDFIERVYE